MPKKSSTTKRRNYREELLLSQDKNKALLNKISKIEFGHLLLGIALLIITALQVILFRSQNNLVSHQNTLIGYQYIQDSIQTSQMKIQNTVFIEQTNGITYQNQLIMTQNDLIAEQNAKVDLQMDLLKEQNSRLSTQNRLIEADRRSSLVIEIGNVLNEISKEISENKKDGRSDKKLSKRLIGRIISLSKVLKPYRYLENDKLIERLSSPERGLLLQALLASDLDETVLNEIFKFGDFAYAQLIGIDLSRTSFTQVDFSGSNFSHMDFSFSDLRNVNLSYTNLRGSNFKGAELVGCLFTGADLRDSDLRETYITYDIFKRKSIDEIPYSTLRRMGMTDNEINNISFEGGGINFKLEGAKVSSIDWLKEIKSRITELSLKEMEKKYPGSDYFKPIIKTHMEDLRKYEVVPKDGEDYFLIRVKEGWPLWKN